MAGERVHEPAAAGRPGCSCRSRRCRRRRRGCRGQSGQRDPAQGTGATPQPASTASTLRVGLGDDGAPPGRSRSRLLAASPRAPRPGCVAARVRAASPPGVRHGERHVEQGERQQDQEGGHREHVRSTAAVRRCGQYARRGRSRRRWSGTATPAGCRGPSSRRGVTAAPEAARWRGRSASHGWIRPAATSSARRRSSRVSTTAADSSARSIDRSMPRRERNQLRASAEGARRRRLRRGLATTRPDVGSRSAARAVASQPTDQERRSAAGAAPAARGPRHCRRRRPPRRARRRAVRPSRPGTSGHQGVVHLHAAPGQQPQGGVVRAQPLGVPQHGSGQPEGRGRPRSATSRVSTAGRVGGLHDQPAGSGGQGDAGGRGERLRAACSARSTRPTGAASSPGCRRVPDAASLTRPRRPEAGAGRRCRQARASPRARARWSARATIDGSWATTTTPLVRPSSTIVSAMTISVSSSRCAVGSSISTQGRSASTTRASASRARSPAESAGAVLAHRGVRTHRAGLAPAPRGRPAAARPRARRR